MEVNKMNIVNIRATVFEPRETSKRKNTIIANISTYEGKDQDDNPRYSSWSTNFVGECFELAQKLKNRDKIIIRRGKVENQYNKEQDKLYVNVTVFEFELYNQEEEEDQQMVYPEHIEKDAIEAFEEIADEEDSEQYI